MAAFEKVSKIRIQTFQSDVDTMDLRKARLPFVKPPLTSFDPRDHRDPHSEIKVWMAYFNLLKAGFGTGLLGAPLVVSFLGVVLGPIMILFVTLLMMHTHLMLLRCLNEISRQLKIPQISYRYGFRMALLHGPPILHWLGHFGPTLIATTMILSQIGACAAILLYTADNLRDIMDWSSTKIAVKWLIIPYLVLSTWSSTLKVVSYISLFGNILNAISLICVLWKVYDRYREPPLEEPLLYVTTKGLPVLYGFGYLLFNLSAVGVVLSCDKALKQPKILSDTYGVIKVGMLVPCFMSIMFGLLGYVLFGAMDDNILRSLPLDEPVVVVALWFYMITVATGFPLQSYPAIQIFLEVIKNHDPHVIPAPTTVKLLEYFCRPLYVLIVFIIAYTLPFQSQFVAFSGNLVTTFVAVIFPALMEIGLLYPDNYGKYNYLLAKNVGLVIFFTTVMVVGVVECFQFLKIKTDSSGVSTLPKFTVRY